MERGVGWLLFRELPGDRKPQRGEGRAREAGGGWVDGGKEREKGGGRAAESWAKGGMGKREERSGEGERDSSQGWAGRRERRVKVGGAGAGQEEGGRAAASHSSGLAGALPPPPRSLLQQEDEQGWPGIICLHYTIPTSSSLLARKLINIPLCLGRLSTPCPAPRLAPPPPRLCAGPAGGHISVLHPGGPFASLFLFAVPSVQWQVFWIRSLEVGTMPWGVNQAESTVLL